MSITTSLAIYFLLWWVTLFAVLPWGVRSQGEVGDVVHGSDPGAPAVPRMLIKLLWTTLTSAVLFGLIYIAYTRHWVTLDGMARFLGVAR